MSSWTDTQRTVLRAGLVALAVAPAWIGAWATAAPHSFYGNFPAAGRHWVAGLPPYNEHLVRDYASASLGFLVLLVFAAVVLERRLVQGALLAYAVAAIPHFVYHTTTTGHFGTLDNVLSLGSLALGFVVPLALLPLTFQRRGHAPAKSVPAASGGAA